MKCKICSKMFTPRARTKLSNVCDECDSGISQNDSEHSEDSFENKTPTESTKYYNDQMNFIDKQIKNLEKKSDYYLENTTDLNHQKKPLTTIERLRKYMNSPKPEKISKKSQLENLKKKYPFVKSPFNKFQDRDQFKQYWPLTSGKNMKIAEFVLKWECEHKKRIHTHMATELLTEWKEKGEVSDEYLEEIHKKYEYY